MRRPNQIAYGDLFSSSNFSQSSYESRFKRHPNEILDNSCQGSSQLMFSQAENSDSQINSQRQSLTSDATRKLSSDSLLSKAVQKQSSQGSFQQTPFKSGALPHLGLCRARVQEIEERENMEIVLSSLKTCSSDIKKFEHSFQEKLDNTAVLSESLVTKFFENIKELLSGQFLEFSRVLNNVEVKSNISLEINDIKLILENHRKILEKCSEKVDGSRKLADSSVKSAKKNIDELLCIYAKEQTDLLRCFKEKIEDDFTKKLEALESNILKMAFPVESVKKVCDKDVQVDTLLKELIPSSDILKIQTINKSVLPSPTSERNCTYNVNYSDEISDECTGNSNSDHNNSNIVGCNNFPSNDFPAINLSLPRITNLSSVGSAFDSAIESRLSTPMDLSMKTLSLVDHSDDNNCNNINDSLIELCDEGMEEEEEEEEDDDDDYSYDDLESIVSGNQSVQNKNRVISLKECTYQKITQKTYWESQENTFHSKTGQCIDLSRAGNINGLSFDCPKSTPLSHLKTDASDLVLGDFRCASFGKYQRQAFKQVENQSNGGGTSGPKNIISRSRKQNKVRRSRRLKKDSHLNYPDYDLDMEYVEESDKENYDPNVAEIRRSSRIKKRVIDKSTVEEECSCASNSTKSSDEVSQLFTVLDIY